MWYFALLVLVPSGLVVVVTVWATWVVRGRYLVATVRGASMEPTYRSGEQVLVRRAAPNTVRSNEIVLLRDLDAILGDMPADVLRNIHRGSVTGRVIGPCVIKRVAAVSGDPVPCGRVPALRGVAESTVPLGKLVLLGDNPEASHDSRAHGYYSTEHVLGVVVKRLWNGGRVR